MAKTAVVAAAINRGPFFDPRPFFAKAGHPSNISKYRRGQILYSRGDPADAAFYIEGGILSIAVHSRHGKKAVVSMLGDGDFAGEEALAGRSRRAATASAMTECEISRVEVPVLLQVLQEEPKFSELFIRYLAARRIEVEEDLIDQLLNSTEKRVARRLLLLGQPGKQGRATPVPARITQDMLAAMVGTTQARISFFMNKFRRLGLIDYNGELKIHGSLLSAFLDE